MAATMIMKPVVILVTRSVIVRARYPLRSVLDLPFRACMRVLFGDVSALQA